VEAETGSQLNEKLSGVEQYCSHVQAEILTHTRIHTHI